MKYLEDAVKILKTKGYKITKPRQFVLKIFDESTVPLSAYEISDKIKEIGETGDVVGVYRSLEILEEVGLIHKVLSSGKYLKCKLDLDNSEHSHNHDHHNLVCKNCGRLQEVNCMGIDLLERVVASEYAFKVEYHALEFYGLCADCQQNK